MRVMGTGLIVWAGLAGAAPWKDAEELKKDLETARSVWEQVGSREGQAGWELVGRTQPALSRLGFGAVLTGSGQAAEDLWPGLKRLAPELARSIAVREALLQAASGRAFAMIAFTLSPDLSPQAGRLPPGKATMAMWRGMELLRSKEFTEVQAGLLGGMQWRLEVDADEHEMLWVDELSGREWTATFAGQLRGKGAADPRQRPWRLRRPGEVKPGNELKRLLGLEVVAAPPEDVKGVPGKDAGVKVRSVVPGRLGEEVGVRPGDIVLQVGGEPVRNEEEYSNVLEDMEGEPSLVLTIWREGKKIEVTIKYFDDPGRARRDVQRPPNRFIEP